MPNWQTNPFVLHPSCPLGTRTLFYQPNIALRVREFEFSWKCQGWSFPSWWENPKLSVCNICPGLNIYLLVACKYLSDFYGSRPFVSLIQSSVCYYVFVFLLFVFSLQLGAVKCQLLSPDSIPIIHSVSVSETCGFVCYIPLSSCYLHW